MKSAVHGYGCVRPGKTSSSATGRGILSMQGLSYGVVRVDSENSLTSLTLQDCGQVMPGGQSWLFISSVLRSIVPIALK